MLTQIDIKLIMVIVAVFSAIFVAYTAIYKHIANAKKHPCSNDIVYKDVCKANQDCLETKIDSLKELLEQRFDSIEELIKNNGHSKPRVQT